MTDTTRDTETGLPLLGGAVSAKKVPIDPKLLPELRDLEDKMNAAEKMASDFGLKLAVSISTAAGIGAMAARSRYDWTEFVKKIAALHGIAPEAIRETDLENGLLILA